MLLTPQFSLSVLFMYTCLCMFMCTHVDWEVCLLDKEAWICYDQDSGVWTVVAGRGGPMWGRCQRDQGRQNTCMHTQILNSVVLHMQVNINSLFARLCFVLHLVRCSSSSKSALRCGSLTHQVRIRTNMEMVDNLPCTLIHVHGHCSFATLGTVLIVCKIYFDVLHFILSPWPC